MAKAPTPGVGKRMADADAMKVALAQKVTLSQGGRTLSFSLGDLGPRDDLACRKATGWNVAELLSAEQVGGLEVLAIWWLARRQNGEPDLSFDDVLDEFPTVADILAAGFAAPEVDDTETDAPEA